MHAFVTGATGYMGRRLIPELARRRHQVSALVRKGSEDRIPTGCDVVFGDALDAATYRQHVAPADVFVHLVGVAHPSPAKAAEFRAVDLASIKAAVSAAKSAGIRHFIYVSVAHPAPAMKAYIAIRVEGESIIRTAGFDATILRPWYVLGPNHWWPVVLLPAYWIMERFPRTREGASRLGLVRLPQMIGALVHAVENPAKGIRVIEVPEIRRLGGLQFRDNRQ